MNFLRNNIPKKVPGTNSRVQCKSGEMLKILGQKGLHNDLSFTFTLFFE